MKSRHAFLVLLALLLSWSARAQRIDPAVVGVSGGSVKTASVSVSWTVGQTAVETRTAHAGTITEGFQQSFLSVASSKDRSIPFTLDLFPNPARSSVLVTLDGVEENMTLVLYNLLGEVLQRQDVRSGDQLARLSVDSYPSGLYLLVAFSGGGEKLATHKIVKAQ